MAMIREQSLRSNSLGSPNSVTNLRPSDAQDNPFWYTFKVQCTSCRETHPNWVGVSRFVSLNPCDSVEMASNTLLKEQNEMSGSRGEANFVWKCKNCKVSLEPAQTMESFFLILSPCISESHRPPSKQPQRHTSMQSRPRHKTSFSSTAVDVNSLNSSPR